MCPARHINQDQPWFGFRCRDAADLKSRAWRRLRASSTQANREAYIAACRNMANTQKAAIQGWNTDLTAKLSSQNVGKKESWSSLKQQQGLATDTTIPPTHHTERVWHQGVTAKLRSLGVCGGLLHLLEDYIHGRTLHTVVDGHSSSQHPKISGGAITGKYLIRNLAS
ncbi:hypothetical protein E2C01_088374 [Portunus trituberculatus]|uniref:Uncharacterized protein n=1 Tax=Portunus trituberculatus TaxID=210409 RepID=A0A5B7J923_PORTR|nr:hypothetical protein [Portunus trituberculatus]